MKKIIKIICGCIMLILLSGCNVNTNKAEVDVSSGITTNLIVTANFSNGEYFYVIDKNTGVVYLGYNGAYRFGITVMVNPDGTPVTAEQLEIQY